MNVLALIIILLTIFLGSLITILSSHLILMWAGLEMSMLAVIPALMYNSNPRSTEAATKYFLTQATASMIFLLAIILNYNNLGSWEFHYNTEHYIFTLILLALMMKLGLAPFHFWVPEVTQGIPILSGLLLLTWQKIAPLAILFQIAYSINSTIVPLSAIMSVFIGGWGGLNQTQLRKILAYSSIAHMGWMVAVTMYNPSMMLLNLIIYMFLTTSMFITIYINNSTSIASLTKMWNKSPLMISTTLIILLSLGGLPPLTGFLPKWMIIIELTKNNCIFMALWMTMMALLNLYFYTRLIYASSMTMFPSTNNMKTNIHQSNNKNNLFLSPLIIISSLALPLSPIINVLY
uniref:NADH-ubiquinone oxidoreductase chain 2 n=1 Tax=Eospalax fontanierii cansus TaxID=146133 RepID=M9Q116_EOSFC|nr:NADH dehydrogenase subunit 2 [Eospalax fontanierii cansus]AGH27166.1 NADH dehydrogenase subunit 2 [Eospalax fontanierii cansus]